MITIMLAMMFSVMSIMAFVPLSVVSIVVVETDTEARNVEMN